MEFILVLCILNFMSSETEMKHTCRSSSCLSPHLVRLHQFWTVIIYKWFSYCWCSCCDDVKIMDFFLVPPTQLHFLFASPALPSFVWVISYSIMLELLSNHVLWSVFLCWKANDKNKCMLNCYTITRVCLLSHLLNVTEKNSWQLFSSLAESNQFKSNL